MVCMKYDLCPCGAKYLEMAKTRNALFSTGHQWDRSRLLNFGSSRSHASCARMYVDRIVLKRLHCLVTFNFAGTVPAVSFIDMYAGEHSATASEVLPPLGKTSEC
jgi:hypothetical protein